MPDGILMATSFGLEVWYEGNWHATIAVPRDMFAGKLCGLCGEFSHSVCHCIIAYNTAGMEYFVLSTVAHTGTQSSRYAAPANLILRRTVADYCSTIMPTVMQQ